MDVTRFSTPRITPSPVATCSFVSREGYGLNFGWRVVLTPIAVEPSLMASREYSTWKSRPSGENVLELGLELQNCNRINVDRRTLSRDLQVC